MKLTTPKLKQIIKEELEALQKEAGYGEQVDKKALENAIYALEDMVMPVIYGTPLERAANDLHKRLYAMVGERTTTMREVDEEDPSAEPAGEAEAGEEEEGKPDAPQDVANFAAKLESSGLDDYIMKINKPDELYGLISVILKTALESESPINEKMIAQVLKKAFKGEWV